MPLASWWCSLLLLSSLPLLSLLSAPARAGDHTVILGVEDARGVAAIQAAAVDFGASSARCWRVSAQCILEFPGEPPLAALEALPGVDYVERDGLIPMVPTTLPAGLAGGSGTPLSAPGGAALPPPAPAPGSDADGTSACPDLWDVEAIGLTAAWAAVGSAGAGAPVVAIEDGGFLITHVDLDGTYSGGLDYGDNDWDVGVEYSVSVPAHGTFIAGVIAGRDDNDAGRVGILPEGELNYQKIADSSGAFYWSYAIAAMNDLADGDLGVRVLNYSIGSSSSTSGFEDAVDALGEAGILLVAAAGNCSVADCWDGNNDAYPMYPASLTGEHIVSVAGSTRTDALNSYSHYGLSSVDLAAPGVDICSLGVSSTTDTYTAAGTSYATPLVAGVAALIWEAHPDLTATEVARVLRASAEDVPALATKVRSGGRLDAEAAVKTALARSGQPDDVEVSEYGTLSYELTSVAAEGEAQILVLHGDSVRVDRAEGWTVERLFPGDTVELYDAGEVELSSHGALLTASLPAHSEQTVTMELRGVRVASEPASVRLVVQSEGADYLNSPWSAGAEDETGFLAWDLLVKVTATAPPTETGTSDSGDTDLTDSGAGSGGGDDAQGDDGPDDGSDAASDDGGGGGGEDGGCACASTRAPRAAYLWLLGGVLLVASRRRRRSTR